MAKKQTVENDGLESIDHKKSGDTITPLGTDLASVADSLVSSMPDVNEHAIQHEQQITDEKAAEYADLVDKNGHGFDPKIHKTYADGSPKLTAGGKLSLRPGRKNTDNSRSQSVIGGLNTDTQKPITPTPQAQARATGKAAANILITLAVQVGGEEFYPVKNDSVGVDEKLMLEGAFADYFEATGRTDFPPGMALTIAVSGYMLPRLTMPKTRTRMEKFKMWAAEKIAKRRANKNARYMAAHKNATPESDI